MLKTVKCINCNEEFETETQYKDNRPKFLFCSKDCLDIWNETLNTKQVVCRICGKTFKQLRKIDGCYEEKTTCLECSKKIQCQYCGEYYMPERDSRGRAKTKYCSQTCCDAWNLEKNPRKQKCKHCGKEFTILRDIRGYYSESVYCSEECIRAQCEKDTQRKVKCKFCGKDFILPKRQYINKEGYICYENIKKRYCSEECYKNACQTSYNYQSERVCKDCGKTFIMVKAQVMKS